MVSFAQADTLSFYSLADFTDTSAHFLAQRGLQKYLVIREELPAITAFAEKMTRPGFVVFWHQDTPYIVCSQVYDYRLQSTQTLHAIFNAQLADSSNAPDYYVTIDFGQLCQVNVPIAHTYCRHILWEEELGEIIDHIEAINQYWQDLADDEDDDDDDFYHYLYY